MQFGRAVKMQAKLVRHAARGGAGKRPAECQERVEMGTAMRVRKYGVFIVERKLLAASVLSLGILIGLGCASYRTERELTETANWVAHTQRVLREIETTRSNYHDSRLSLRIYGLDHSESSYRAYQESFQIALEHLQRLARLTHFNGVAEPELENLQALMSGRLRELDRQIAAERARRAGQKGVPSAVAPAWEKRDATERTLKLLEAQERLKLRQRARVQQGRVERSMLFTGMGHAFALLIALGGAVWLHNDLVRRKRAEAALELANVELEEKVESRTGELTRTNEMLQREVAGRMRAHARLEGHLRQQDMLTVLSRRALEGQALDKLMQEASGRVARVMGTDLVMVLEALPKPSQGLVLSAGVGWRGGLVGSLELEAGPGSQLAFALENAGPLVIEDFSREKRFAPLDLALSHRAVCGISAALKNGGETLGILAVLATRPVTFGPDDQMFVQAVADVLSNAIQRKRAEQEIRQLNEGLEKRVRERTTEVEEVNKELEAFSYSVSHDLRAPLRQIAGFSRLLAQELNDKLTPASEHYLDQIQKGVRKMSQLIDDLLRLARIGTQPLALQPVALRAIVDRARADLSLEWEGRVVEWHISPLPDLSCDPALIQQVVVNLLSNALKFTRLCEKAVIQVGAMTVNDQPVVFVRDNGVGFEMKYAHKLFDVFQRLHNSKQYEGAGIGLATAQRIIRKHGGRIWCEAEVGHGAIFYFTAAPIPHTGKTAGTAGKIVPLPPGQLGAAG